MEENFGGRLQSVILKRCAKELERVLRMQTDENEHHALHLNFLELAEEDPDLADALLKHPRRWFSEVEDLLLYYGLVDAQIAIAENLNPAFKQARDEAAATGQPEPRHPALVPKRVLHLRMVGLPFGMDAQLNLLHPAVSAVGTCHINHLIVISGTVVRTGGVKQAKQAQDFECTKCKWVTRVRCKLEDGGLAPQPDTCSNTRQVCTNSKFKILPEGQMFTGFQELKVQEKSACLAMGAMPSSLPVVLQDELVDKFQCGDDIQVTGVVAPRWQPMFPGQRIQAELVVMANNVQVLSKRQGRTLEVHDSTAAKFMAFWDAHKRHPLTARNKILAGICPQIHGMFLVKLATALSMCGGVARPDEHLRGDVHLLLIGDPGIGKSQIMKFAARTAHRSVMASGKATSGAGLTAAAVKDGGGWILEAGALVLADGGVCCIDEFDGIKESDRAMIHEAMEQQTVHVAKAGMVTTLSTRTTVVAAVNPKPGWKPSQGLAAATNISGPLLSRFDLVLLLLDMRHPERDKLVASRVLDNHQQGAQQQAPGKRGNSGAGIGPEGGTPLSTLAPSQLEAQSGWSLDILRAYLVWTKNEFSPVMTSAAETVLQAYYQALRQAEDRSAARTTIRMLESLVRVAQAHARLCARRSVTRQDAVIAVLLVDSSQGALHIMGQDAALASNFAQEPDAEYTLLEERVLRELGLSQLLALPGPGDGNAGGARFALPGPPGGNAPAGQTRWSDGNAGGGGGPRQRPPLAGVAGAGNAMGTRSGGGGGSGVVGGVDPSRQQHRNSAQHHAGGNHHRSGSLGEGPTAYGESADGDVGNGGQPGWAHLEQLLVGERTRHAQNGRNTAPLQQQQQQEVIREMDPRKDDRDICQRHQGGTNHRMMTAPNDTTNHHDDRMGGMHDHQRRNAQQDIPDVRTQLGTLVARTTQQELESQQRQEQHTRHRHVSQHATLPPRAPSSGGQHQRPIQAAQQVLTASPRTGGGGGPAGQGVPGKLPQQQAVLPPPRLSGRSLPHMDRDDDVLLPDDDDDDDDHHHSVNLSSRNSNRHSMNGMSPGQAGPSLGSDARINESQHRPKPQSDADSDVDGPLAKRRHISAHHTRPTASNVFLSPLAVSKPSPSPQAMLPDAAAAVAGNGRPPRAGSESADLSTQTDQAMSDEAGRHAGGHQPQQGQLPLVTPTSHRHLPIAPVTNERQGQQLISQSARVNAGNSCGNPVLPDHPGQRNILREVDSNGSRDP